MPTKFFWWLVIFVIFIIDIFFVWGNYYVADFLLGFVGGVLLISAGFGSRRLL